MIRVDEVVEYPPVMIKDAHTRRNGYRWSHLNADTEEELHAMAARLGLKRAWYQQGRLKRFDPYYSHYDIVPSKRTLAIRYGAIFVPAREQAKAMLERRGGL